MGILGKLALLFSFAVSGNCFADEVDINYTTESGQIVAVSGKTTTSQHGIVFTPTSEEGGNRFLKIVLSSFDKTSLRGEVSVHLLNKDSAESQSIVFQVRGEESSVSLIGKLNDGSILTWTQNR